MSQHGPNDGCGELLWEHMSAEPGFDEELRQARAEIADGRGVPFSAAPQPLDVEKVRALFREMWHESTHPGDGVAEACLVCIRKAEDLVEYARLGSQEGSDRDE